MPASGLAVLPIGVRKFDFDGSTPAFAEGLDGGGSDHADVEDAAAGPSGEAPMADLRWPSLAVPPSVRSERRSRITGARRRGAGRESLGVRAVVIDLVGGGDRPDRAGDRPEDALMMGRSMGVVGSLVPSLGVSSGLE